jgi:hypothetical protein
MCYTTNEIQRRMMFVCSNRITDVTYLDFMLVIVRKSWNRRKHSSEPQGYAERSLGTTVSTISVQCEGERECGVGWENATSTTCRYVQNLTGISTWPL